MRHCLAAVVAFALALPSLAHAGRGCEVRPPDASDLRNALSLALQVRDALDASDAEAAVIARAGQDLRRYGLRFSHAGLVYRSGNTGDRWRIVHKLNDCGGASSAVYRHGLANFFTERPWRYRAQIVTLRPAVAGALVAVLDEPGAALRMHAPAYSVLSNPWSTRYQQSNEWLIETLAMAAHPRATDRSTAKAWLRSRGFVPHEIRVGALHRLGARLTRANVRFDDHPLPRRMRGRLQTTTVDSVASWLLVSGLGGRRFEVGL